jgi:predicted RND superfamily exporter protein
VIGRGPLERLMLFCGRRHKLVFAVFVLVVAGCTLLATRLRFDPDVLHLLPTKNPAVITFRETLEQFGSADYFVLGIRIPEEAPLDPFELFADEVAGRLAARTGLIRSVEHSIGEPEELLSQFLPGAVLFLDAQARDSFAAKLGDAALAARAQELRRLLETPQAVAMKEIVKLDPIGVSEVFLDRLGGQRGPLAVDWTSGRYLSRDHRLLLVLAKPVGNAVDLDFNQRLYDAVRADVEAAKTSWGELAEGAGLAPPEVIYGGRYMITLDDSGLIRRDVIVNAATSLVGVLALFYIAYRRLSLLLLVFWPLACGLAITFGFSALAVGVLSSATAGVAALLVGLGDDFVIVLYGRYVEARQSGMPVIDALRSMGGATARGVVLGAVTTTATFYAFLITDFTGLFQMGLIIGTGTIFCLVAVLCLVPAMIGWSEEHHRKRDREPRLHMFAFGIEKLTALAIRRPRTTLAVAALLTLAAGLAVPQLKFDDNVEALRPPGNRGILAQQEVNLHFGAGFESMSLVLEAPTLEEVLALSDRAARSAQSLVRQGRLGGADAVTAVLPPPAQQEEALAWLARGRESGALDIARIRASFEAALSAEGLRAAPFERGLDLLARTLAPAGAITRESLMALPQGATLLERYLREAPKGWRSVVKLYNVTGRPKREVPEAAVELAANLGPQAKLTGMNVLSRGLRHEIRRDAIVSGIIGLVLVMILLWIDFRDVRTALLAFVPLLVGIVWMVGLMVAFDFHLNFMNIFVITMIIGIGVDYGIHVIHRYLEVRQEGGDPKAAVEETVRGVFLAALTTIVGFGSLATSHYPGLISMGLVSILGTLSTAMVAIVVVPAYLSLRDGPRRAG